MADIDHIFLKTGVSPAEAALRIAEALGGSTSTDENGLVFVALEVPEPRPHQAGGQLSANIFLPVPDPEPDELSVLDGYDTMWEIRVVPKDEELMHGSARRIFDQVAARLPWPAVLVDSLSLLVAAYSPAAGRRDFPAGTTPDGDDRAAWAPFDLVER